MVTDKLKEFLQKKAGSAPPDIDWSARRDRYIGAVERLYNTILSDYLGGSETAGLVEVERSFIEIQEPFVGRYDIPKLLLSIGKQQVEFVPKGSVIAGAAGRVDVVGEASEVVLAWEQDDRWTVVYSRTPRLLTAPFNAAGFLGVLRRVMS